MNKGLISQATIVINAPITRVWEALVTPVTIKQYICLTNNSLDWKQSTIV